MVFGYILLCNTKNSVFSFFVQYLEYAKKYVAIVTQISWWICYKYVIWSIYWFIGLMTELSNCSLWPLIWLQRVNSYAYMLTYFCWTAIFYDYIIHDECKTHNNNIMNAQVNEQLTEWYYSNKLKICSASHYVYMPISCSLEEQLLL